MLTNCVHKCMQVVLLLSFLVGISLANEVCLARQVNGQTPIIPSGGSIRVNANDGSPCFQTCSCPETSETTSLIADCTVNQCMNPRGTAKNCSVSKSADTWSFEIIESATQGNCVCYFDQMICEQPNPDAYTLQPGGIYLFLGYSIIEEQLLTRWTNLEARNLTDALQELIGTPTHNHKTKSHLSSFKIFDPFDRDSTKLSMARDMNRNGCKLSTYAVTPGNVIITVTNDKHKYKNTTDDLSEEEKLKFLEDKNNSGRLPHGTYEFISFRHLKAHCEPILKEIIALVTSKAPVVYNHPLLSIIKVAGYKEVSYYEGNGAPITFSDLIWTVPLYFIFVFLYEMIIGLFILELENPYQPQPTADD